MLKFYKKEGKWQSILRAVRTADGFDLGDDYRLRIQNDEFVLIQKKRNAKTWDDVLHMRIGHTNYCCGVAQLGNFREYALINEMPDSIGDAAFHIITTYCRRYYNKGIIQAWFQKYPNAVYGTSRGFEYAKIRAIFTRNGMKKFGRQTYNPNSGNRIIGYQGSMNKHGVEYGNS
jgi:hypothetical protein